MGSMTPFLRLAVLAATALALRVGVAEAHLCGPSALTVVQGDTVAWKIVADLDEELSLYTPLTLGAPAIVAIAPDAPFMARDGEFAITGIGVGGTTFAIRWLYEPTGASGVCSAGVTVVPRNGLLCTPQLVQLAQGQTRIVTVRVFEDGVEVNRNVAASFAADTIDVSPQTATSPATFIVSCATAEPASTSILFSAGASGSCSTLVLCNGAPAPTPSPTPDSTPTPAATATPTSTPTPTPTATPTPTPSATPKPTPTASATPVSTPPPTPPPTPVDEPTPNVVDIDVHPIQVVQEPAGAELEETIELVADKATMVRVFVLVDAAVGSRFSVTGVLRAGGREQRIEADLLVERLPDGRTVALVVPLGDAVFRQIATSVEEHQAFNFFTAAAGPLQLPAGEHEMEFTLELRDGGSVSASETFAFKTSFAGFKYDVLYAFLETFDFAFLSPVPDGYANDMQRFFERFIAVYPIPREQAEWTRDGTKYQVTSWDTFSLWMLAASIDSAGRSFVDRFVILVPGAEGGRKKGLLQEEEEGILGGPPEGITPYTISETVVVQVRSSDFNLAHEFGHTYRLGIPSLNIGRGHNEEPADAGWDVREVTGSGLRLKREGGGGTFNALMFPTANDDTDGWITYQEYNELLDQFLDDRGTSANVPSSPQRARAASSQKIASAAASGDVLVVSGTIFASGAHVLFPFFQSTGAPTAPGPRGAGVYTLAVLGVAGDEISRAELSPIFGDLGGAGDLAAPFLARLPFRADAARIELRQGDTLLEARLVSASPPSVSIVELMQVGATSFEAEIAGSDPDGDALEYAVSYTPDGERFVDAHVQWLEPGRRFLVDVAALPGSAAGRLRVLATDGVRSAAALSDPFAVANHPPLVFVETPLDRTVYGDAQLILLRGSANDLENGTLSGGALAWSSDLAGPLGEGSMLAVPAATLGVGEHLLTLTATDAEGASASESVSISVVREPPPDAVAEAVRARPAGLAPGDPALLEATVANLGVPARAVVSFFEGEPQLGGMLLATSDVFLPAHARTVVVAPWTPAAMGSQTVSVRVSEVTSLGPIEVEETALDDNQTSATIDVGAPGLLAATPDALDFGDDATLLNVVLENQGDGAVTWSAALSGDEQGAVFLSARGSPPSASASATTLGGGNRAVLTVLLDRPGFDDAIHQALLTLSSSAGRIDIPVVYRDGRGAAGLDHYMLYGVKPAKGASRFTRFGSVVLADELGTAAYEVSNPTSLGAPADKNGEGVFDERVHLEEYRLKPAKGTPKFAKRRDIRVVNQCNDVVLEARRPVSLLVPTGKSLDGPATPPGATSRVDHFLCYAAAPQARAADGTRLPKLPAGMQVDVADELQSRRWDLKRITKLCNPVAKSGSPTLLAGPDKGLAKPIAPATIARLADHLVCYRATLAQRRIEQDGCGPLLPGDRGVKLDPRQPAQLREENVFVSNQFGEGTFDSKPAVELCIPSRVVDPRS